MPDKVKVCLKPRNEVFRPELTRLPELTYWRRLYRSLINWIARFLLLIWTRTEVHGLENFPCKGPALVVSNHLGDADWVVGIAHTPVPVDSVAKIELLDIPVLGWLMDAYGVIWVHRGRPDRKALRVIQEGLKAGRFIGITPEGRESLSGALEEGTGGAAYLALKTGVPIIPVTFTGTENRRVYGNMKHFRRTDIAVTVGSPFRLQQLPDRREAIWSGTQKIMHTLAQQLPPGYRGAYND